MDDRTLLDGLFLVIALLLVPIGYRRGLTREVFVTAGLLAGTKLAESWARPWGGDVEDLIDIRRGGGAFAVSAAFILGGAVLLGYAGAAAARIERPSVWQRLTGAMLAVMNGTLIAAFVLRDIERYLADAGTQRRLEESEIARALLREFGWVLVAMATLAFLSILISMIAGGRRTSLPVATTAGSTWQPASVGKRKSRLGWGRDDGKLEPEARGFDPSAGRYAADAPHYAETMPIAPVSPTAWSMDRAQGRTGGSEWLEMPARQHEPVPAAGRHAGEDGAQRCLSCGERLYGDEAFCPRCGRARG